MERARWIAEVKFLKAYYHFFLMQLYGPIVIADKELPLSTAPADLMAYREPVDECVDYIVGLLDEAIPDLPLVLPDPATEQGRISQTIALSVKRKCWHGLLALCSTVIPITKIGLITGVNI